MSSVTCDRSVVFTGYSGILHKSQEFEDTKGVIRIHISKKNRQNNGQKKKDKRTNNDLQNGGDWFTYDKIIDTANQTSWSLRKIT